MHAERISGLNCRCAGWWFGVAHSPPASRCIPSYCERKALSFCVHLELHNTTQHNAALCTLKQSHDTVTHHQCSSALLLNRDCTSRQTTVIMRHEWNQTFNQVFVFFAKCVFVTDESLRRRPSFHIKTVYLRCCRCWKELKKKKKAQQ